jgi:hypothetical protein
MTQATETRIYDVREQFQAEVKPLMLQLKEVCERLGIPLVVRAWPGANHEGVFHEAVVDAHRAEVHASFAAAVFDANANSMMEKMFGVMRMGEDAANYYSVEVDPDGDGFRLSPIEEDDDVTADEPLEEAQG